jgi:DNA-binding transcriptional MerR regulator
MRIGEVAERAGVNVETLRYYERRGLLPEPARGPRGHRRYDDETVRFVRAVKEAQGLGFTLAEIEEYLRLARRSGAAPDALRVRLATKIDEVDAKIASLHRVREDLARVLGCACETLDRCTCGAAYLARRGRDPEPRPGDALHVTNGESAGNTLRRTGIDGAVLAWDDVLHEGPVPDGSPARVRDARARFLAGCGWGDARTIRASLERRDRHLDQALRDGRPVVLWFEHDLYDQLQLLQIFARVGPDAEHVELIEVGSFPGRPGFRGLGELTAEELESLWPQRRPPAAARVELAALAWDAFRAPDPRSLEDVLGRDTSAAPFLAAALRRLLEELPDARTGLSRSERQLLDALTEGPRTPVELFLHVQDAEEAPFDGDAWVWRRLAGLAGLVARADGGLLPRPAAARRRPHVRVDADRAHRRGPRRARGRRRPGRAARDRPLARRHAPARRRPPALERRLGARRLELADRVAGPYGTGLDHARVDPAQAQLAPGALVHELDRLGAEARGELRAAGVELLGDLDHGRPDGEPCARGQVLVAEVEVDEELVAGERPPLPVARDGRDRACVHQRQLHVGVRGAVLGAAAPARAPHVADEALVEVEKALVEHLALVLGGPADDQLERPLVGRRLADRVQVEAELVGSRIRRHGLSLLTWSPARDPRAPSVCTAPSRQP